MKSSFSAKAFPIVCGLALFAQGLVAQNYIQIFSAADVRTSPSTAGYAAPYGSPYAFSTTNVSLTCDATSPITAQLSGPTPGAGGSLVPGGNLLVDNNILVTATPSTGTAYGPVNVCTGFNQGLTYTAPDGSTQSVPALYQENCFTLGYATPATGPGYPQTGGPLNGKDLDTYSLTAGGPTIDQAGGVPPIDIGPLISTAYSNSGLTSGDLTLNIALEDEGGILTSSSMYLLLSPNCTYNGVTGPSTILGNTIPTTSSTLPQSQNFDFNTNTGQLVGFVYNVGGAPNLTNGNNSNSPYDGTATAIGGDMQVDPTKFQPNYVSGTPFATSNCIIHTGELLNKNPACKLYTLECTTPTNSTPSGANCPVSAVEDEVVSDSFDGPPFPNQPASATPNTLPDIYSSTGTLIAHEGIGLLMASEDWPGNGPSPIGPCTFEANSGLSALPCPQNLLRDFEGPGVFSGSGLTTNPNSTFISIYGVPEPLTTVSLQGAKAGNWVNTSTPGVGFISTPPNLSKGAYVQLTAGGPLSSLPGAASFVPAPIESITYGVTPANANPFPAPLNEPITGDVSVPNIACPTSITAPTASSFKPPKQTLGPLGDGQYLLHYYAQDCAGTQELQFTTIGGSWTTGFYTFPINIDTTPPMVTLLSPLPAPSISKGTTEYVNFACTDASTGSGVTHCSSYSFATGTTYNTGPLSFKLNTSAVGQYTVPLVAIDGAGNSFTLNVIYSVTK